MEVGHSYLQDNQFLLGLPHRRLQGRPTSFFKSSSPSSSGGRRAAAPGGATGDLKKGPWTEQEDLQLLWFVKLFGERRWDFLAKVSGLNRSGKSCRLRWVNYLSPGLKRGRMTADEESLILELHSKWGNRWSRIAQRLPGRTDNEIKNYWRTHMRKKAQERRISPSPPPSSSSSSSTNGDQCLGNVKGYTMDQIWNEIAASDSVCAAGSGDLSSLFGTGDDQRKPERAPDPPPPSMAASPVWVGSCSSDDQSLWRIDDEFNMLTTVPDLMGGGAVSSTGLHRIFYI